MKPPKSILRPLLVAVVAAALAGHVAWWYLPRARPVRVDASSPAGRLFAGGTQSARLWLAYPHQNVVAAAERMEDPGAAMKAAARLAGVGDLELPAFGPFTLPPADAIAIAGDPGGGRIEVFPSVAVVARIAGMVASNPVLRGGSTVVSGRPVQIAWQGWAWTLTSEGADPPRDASDLSLDPGLAFLTLAQRQGAALPGTYRLRWDGDDLVLGTTRDEAPAESNVLTDRLALEHDLAFVGLRAKSPEAMSLLLMPRMRGDGKLRLPDSASAWTVSDERWRLPGEKILRILGIDPLSGQSGAWTLEAMEEKSLDVATRVAPVLGDEAVARGASFVLWVRPLEYLMLVSTISGVLGALPIAPRDEVEHWRDLETLLETLGPVDRVVVTVAPDGSEARMGWSER